MGCFAAYLFAILDVPEVGTLRRTQAVMEILFFFQYIFIGITQQEHHTGTKAVGNGTRYRQGTTSYCPLYTDRVHELSDRPKPLSLSFLFLGRKRMPAAMAYRLHMRVVRCTGRTCTLYVPGLADMYGTRVRGEGRCRSCAGILECDTDRCTNQKTTMMNEPAVGILNPGTYRGRIKPQL